VLSLLSGLADTFDLSFGIDHQTFHDEWFILFNLELVIELELGDLDKRLEHLSLMKDFRHVIFAVVVKSDDMSMDNLVEFVFVIS
jgi:hypothetical protein